MSDPRLKLLYDVLCAADDALTFVGDEAFASFRTDRLRRAAVERQLDLIGEAGERLFELDAAFAETLPDLRLAAEVCRRVLHGPDGVDEQIVYRFVHEDVPALRAAVRGVVNKLARLPR